MGIQTYTEETIVCYCSDISVSEIRCAVENGCNNIAEVRYFLGKHINGKCETTSPSKKCCHKFFNEVVSNVKKQE